MLFYFGEVYSKALVLHFTALKGTYVEINHRYDDSILCKPSLFVFNRNSFLMVTLKSELNFE